MEGVCRAGEVWRTAGSCSLLLAASRYLPYQTKRSERNLSPAGMQLHCTPVLELLAAWLAAPRLGWLQGVSTGIRNRRTRLWGCIGHKANAAVALLRGVLGHVAVLAHAKLHRWRAGARGKDRSG